MPIERHADVRGYFQERLVTALERHRVRPLARTEVYLVNLLGEFAVTRDEELLARPLVELLAHAMEAEGIERLRRFRDMGDAALYVLGFFSDHLERRGIAHGYVASMGGRAYQAAESMAQRARASDGGMAEVFGELADRFEEFARVLEEVRESTALRTPQEIVKLYEKWRRTGSPTLAKRLEQEGVFPQVVGRGGRTVH